MDWRYWQQLLPFDPPKLSLAILHDFPTNTDSADGNPSCWAVVCSWGGGQAWEAIPAVRRQWLSLAALAAIWKTGCTQVDQMGTFGLPINCSNLRQFSRRFDQCMAGLTSGIKKTFSWPHRCLRDANTFYWWRQHFQLQGSLLVSRRRKTRYRIFKKKLHCFCTNLSIRFLFFL